MSLYKQVLALCIKLRNLVISPAWDYVNRLLKNLENQKD